MDDGRRPTIADVPGLIEGASDGAGLGHAFLRHVERTRVLLHVVDGASRDPQWDHDIIRDELEAHDPALLAKPMLVVFNKMDLPAAPDGMARVRCRAARSGPRRRGDLRGHGRGPRRAASRGGPRCCPDADVLAEPPDPAGVVVHRLEAAGDGFTIERDEEGFVVRGKRIERLAVQTNFDNEESAERFQRELLRLGVDAALRKAGVRPGDDVRIGGVALAWDPPEEDA